MPLPAEVVVYTDGGKKRNKSVGAWAAILLFEDSEKKTHEREISGVDPDTTSNRMEIIAVLEALRALKRPCHVRVYSDSQYVVNSIGNWINGRPVNTKSGYLGWMVYWKSRNWSRKEGELKNVDLWQLLDVEVRRHSSVVLTWVRGHNGNYYNERCDVLCTEAIKSYCNGKTATKGDGLPEHANSDGGDGNRTPTPGIGESVRLSGSGNDRS